MRQFRLTIALFAALAGAVPAAAQDAAGPGDDTILVEGEREGRNREARDQAREITSRPGSVAAPLARFQRPICPGVFGASEESARLMIDRILHNAERVGLETVDGEGCTANIVVAFVDDPQDEFRQLRTANHYLADGLSFWDAKRVTEQEGPVLAWNVTITRTRDGQLPPRGKPPVYETTASGRTDLGVREDIEVSVVMVRRDAVGTMDAVTLADYATMRALAQTEPPHGDTAFGTVLTLFDEGAAAPDRLTDFDLAYLTSLYRSAPNTPSRMALDDVGRLMERGVGAQ